MTDRTTVTTVRTVAAVGAAVALASTSIWLAAGHIDDWWRGHHGVATLITIGTSLIVWIVVPHQPHNRSVWAMSSAPLAGVALLGFALAPFLAAAEPGDLRYPNYVPADHPASVDVLLAAGEIVVTIGVFVPLTFGLLLFPTGSLPSRRRRWIGWWAGGSIVAVCVGYGIAPRLHAEASPEGWTPLGAAQFALVAAMALTAATVFERFREGSGEVRQQCAWVLWGGSLATVAFGSGMLIAGSDLDPLSPVLVFAGFAVLLSSYGVAIGRHHLYDVDLVISRTIVYASLAVAITGAYVAVVVGVGRLVGGGDRPDTLLAITMTAVVAAVFQPLRRRLQQLADRLVSGRRASPHAVLSEFVKRVSANDDGLLELVARRLVEGTGARLAEIWVRGDGGSTRTVVWPLDVASGGGALARFPIQHHGVEHGALLLELAPGHRLSGQDRILAEQVASGMGLALRNRTMTGTLERRITELRASRRRLIEVQDDTRRRLERDLHDGAQQQLVALRVKLGLARTVAERDGARRTATTLASLAGDADRLVEDVREFARGVYPPLLEVDGLSVAVAACARRQPVPVELELDGLARYDRSVESTVNACIAETLRQLVSPRAATAAAVSIASRDGLLEFVVRCEYSPDGTRPTSGGVELCNINDRIDAIGGSLRVACERDVRTIVTGAVPFDDSRAGVPS